MFRLRTDEDVHVDVIDGDILRVRRLTKGELRWEHSLDLTGVYADRFDKPVADTLDGWFGSGGELRLIVHARDVANPRLLPPRELTFAADAPRLDRARPCADRRTLASGALRTHAWSGMTLQIVQELDEHVLATITTAEARQLGWSVADLPDIGYRWFERSEVGPFPALGVTGTCPVCGALPKFGAEHVHGMNPISVDRAHGVAQRVVECHRCLTRWQIDEVLEPGSMKQLWKWTRGPSRGSTTVVPVEVATPPAAPPRIEPSPRPKDPEDEVFAVHEGVRFEGDDFLVMGETAATIGLWKYFDQPNPQLIAQGFTCTQKEDREDPYDQTSWKTEYLHELDIDKRDSRVTGAFLYHVRHRSHVLRVIEERDDWILLVAHHALQAALEFTRTQTPHTWVCFGWVPRARVEVLSNRVV